jgi:hypothetical protein
MAYEECERIAAPYGFDWTECQELYETKNWWNGVFVAEGDLEWLNHEGLSCGDEESLSCSLHEHEDGRAQELWVLVVLLGLIFRRIATNTD